MTSAVAGCETQSFELESSCQAAIVTVSLWSKS